MSAYARINSLRALHESTLSAEDCRRTNVEATYFQNKTKRLLISCRFVFLGCTAPISQSCSYAITRFGNSIMPSWATLMQLSRSKSSYFSSVELEALSENGTAPSSSKRPALSILALRQHFIPCAQKVWCFYLYKRAKQVPWSIRWSRGCWIEMFTTHCIQAVPFKVIGHFCRFLNQQSFHHSSFHAQSSTSRWRCWEHIIRVTIL